MPQHTQATIVHHRAHSLRSAGDSPWEGGTSEMRGGSNRPCSVPRRFTDIQLIASGGGARVQTHFSNRLLVCKSLQSQQLVSPALPAQGREAGSRQQLRPSPAVLPGRAVCAVCGRGLADQPSKLHLDCTHLGGCCQLLLAHAPPPTDLDTHGQIAHKKAKCTHVCKQRRREYACSVRQEYARPSHLARCPEQRATDACSRRPLQSAFNDTFCV